MSTLKHRHGGTITAITGIGHETYKHVASWHFIGNVDWEDGSHSDDLQIAPNAVCADTAAQVQPYMDALNDYLARRGEWHDMKYTRDGRAYSWTPHEQKISESLSVQP